MKHKSANGDGSMWLRGKVWYIGYTLNGRQVRESTHSTRQSDAVALRKKRITEVTSTGTTGYSDKYTKVGEILDDLVSHYRITGVKSLDVSAIHAIKPVREYFGDMLLARVNTSTLTGYMEKRQGLGRANSTINLELRHLRRAFVVATQRNPPKARQVPLIHMLPETGPRQGFFEDEDFQKVLTELPDSVKPVAIFGYNTACRKEEILGLKWGQVDMEHKVVRLRMGETKNGEGRIIPMTGEVARVLSELLERRNMYYPSSPWVFSRNGEKIIEFKNAWNGACERAGKPGALFHDFRRTGVRNLVRSGVSTTVAMMISGHKTDSIFRRYNITSEDDLRDAAKKLGEYMGRQRELVSPKLAQTDKAKAS